MSLVLRRWMTPPEAALICEEDPQCGGFTYKVTLWNQSRDVKNAKRLWLKTFYGCFDTTEPVQCLRI